MSVDRPPPGYRRGSTLIVVALAVGLLLPWLAGDPAGGGLENRRSAEFPDLSARGLLDTATYRQADAALRDRLRLRTTITGQVGKQGIDRLGASMNDRVVVGDDGDLFGSEGFTIPCTYKRRFDIEATARALTSWSRLAAAHDRQLLYAIAPSKATVRREKLSRYPTSLTECSDRVRAQIRSTWGPSGDSTMLLIWDELRKLDQATSGQAYQVGDSHWTTVGASVLASRLVEAVPGPAIDVGDDFAPDRTTRRRGGLYRQLGFSRADVIPVVSPGRDGVHTVLSVAPTSSGRGLRTFTSRSTTQRLHPGRTLVIHDSFATALAPVVAPYFREISFLHWTDFAALVRSGQPMPTFDRLVIESTEAGFTQKSVDFLSTPRVHAAIMSALTRDSVCCDS
ncbi:hypothetical protein ABN034_32845 [Actinopolymorpha sp. B11F2]|uniref:alginate O-acetyltransferase AlgX-related protein n=1 Tax=Actinopolymorpha sp. B11F2 TaxID=3160862 RepID=UPI0032E4B964